MAEMLQLPPDFEWVAAPIALKHRASGKGAEVWTCLTPNQQEIDYLVCKVRYEYRRDRLYAAVGRDIDRFRACQIEMRTRGYRM